MRLVQVAPVYTPPLLPACRATLSANHWVPDATWTKIELDVIEYDTTNDFDIVNHRYVCSEAGKYMIASGIKLKAMPDASVFTVAVYVNGVIRGSRNACAEGAYLNPGISASDILPLEVGDFVEVFCIQTSGAARIAQGAIVHSNYLAVHRLS